MQKVCHIEGGVKPYLENPGCLVNEQTRNCPFCATAHPLRLHGWYWRWALLPDPEGAHRIAVRRLYCPHVRRTVSLLPDFCIPRRQHGPAILAVFVQMLVAGLGLLAALRRVLAEAAWHAVAQSLRDGFLKRAVKIRAYLAQHHRRAIEPPKQIPEDRRRLAELFVGLVEGFDIPQTAFIFHGRRFHERFAEALA